MCLCVCVQAMRCTGSGSPSWMVPTKRTTECRSVAQADISGLASWRLSLLVVNPQFPVPSCPLNRASFSCRWWCWAQGTSRGPTACLRQRSTQMGCMGKGAQGTRDHPVSIPHTANRYALQGTASNTCARAYIVLCSTAPPFSPTLRCALHPLCHVCLP